MPDKVKTLRLFEVAKTVQVTTSEIIAYLEALGYDMARKLVQPIDEAMYIEVLRRFNLNLLRRYRLDRARVLDALSQWGFQSGGGAVAILGPIETEPAPAPEMDYSYVSVREMLGPSGPSKPVEPVATKASVEATEPGAPAEPPNPAHPYLPAATVFAPEVSRVRAPTAIEPLSAEVKEVPKTTRVYRARGPKMPKEKVKMRLLIRRVGPSKRVVPRPGPMIKMVPKTDRATGSQLNNIDLELLEHLVNMSYRNKLALLESLMFGE